LVSLLLSKVNYSRWVPRSKTKVNNYFKAFWKDSSIIRKIRWMERDSFNIEIIDAVNSYFGRKTNHIT